MRLVYHPDAEAELIEATQFLERGVTGLGARFLADFDWAVSTILDAPERWRIVERDVRRYLMHRFPYGIYYRIGGDEARILVVKHHHRHPDYWKHRMDE
jgi:plasmid stabilization system protein ParE